MKEGYKILGSDNLQKAVRTLPFEFSAKLYAFNHNQATMYSLGFSRTALCCSPLLPAFLHVSGGHFEYGAVNAVIKQPIASNKPFAAYYIKMRSKNYILCLPFVTFCIKISN